MYLSSSSGGVLITKVDDVLNWNRKNSLWYLLFGLACCAIELMQTGGPRADVDRFGAVFRATPRQSDLIIVAGTLTYKMAHRVKLLYEQMAEPKYVMSMGSCSNCGGLFHITFLSGILSKHPRHLRLKPFFYIGFSGLLSQIHLRL